MTCSKEGCEADAEFTLLAIPPKRRDALAACPAHVVELLDDDASWWRVTKVLA